MIIRLILCFFTAVALTMRFALPEELGELAGGSKMLNIFYNFQLSLSGTMAASTVILIALVLLERYLSRKQAKRDLLLGFFAFVVAVVWAMGESFREVDSLALWHAGAGQAAKTVVYIVGITWFLMEIGALITAFLEGRWDWKWKEGRLKKMYAAHPFALPFLGLTVCWLPHLLLSYPAAMCVDGWNQMLQFFGVQKFTSHHPPVHTILMGLTEKLGLAVGSANLGLFLHIVLQTLVFALIMAYMFSAMRKLSAPLWLRILSFVIAIVSPYYTQYIGLIVKDNFYSYFILLFVIEVIYMLVQGQEYWHSRRHLLLLAVSVIGSLLFRNNGQYVIYPMMLLILIMLIAQRRKESGRRALAVAAVVFLASAGIAVGTQSCLMQRYGIADGSIKEALSLPFQQTARYVKEHGDEVTKEERKAIRAVLPYQKLGERYDPKISDPVKDTYRTEASTKDLMNYLAVWLQQGLKHPVTYIEATMNQNYYLLYPLAENTTLYDAAETDKVAAGMLAEELGVHEVPLIQKLDRWRTGVNKVLFTLPVFGLLSSMAVFNLILIYLCYGSIKKRIPQMALVLMPLLLSDAVIVLAPVIKGHPRYAFPVIYSIPIVFAAFLYLRNAKELRKNFA